MSRTKIRDLALVALAGGVLAFEVTSLQGAAPLAMRSLVEQGVVGDVQRVSTDAAVAAAAVVTKVSRATTQVAVATVKRAARLMGTVTPARTSAPVALALEPIDVPVFAIPAAEVDVHVVTRTVGSCAEAKAVKAALAARAAKGAKNAQVRVVTLSKSTCRQLHAQRASLRRFEYARRVRIDAEALRELRREIAAARGTTS